MDGQIIISEEQKRWNFRPHILNQCRRIGVTYYLFCDDTRICVASFQLLTHTHREKTRSFQTKWINHLAGVCDQRARLMYLWICLNCIFILIDLELSTVTTAATAVPAAFTCAFNMSNQNHSDLIKARFQFHHSPLTMPIRVRMAATFWNWLKKQRGRERLKNEIDYNSNTLGANHEHLNETEKKTRKNPTTTTASNEKLKNWNVHSHCVFRNIDSCV